MPVSRDVLLSCARVRATKHGGSGTVLYSKAHDDTASTFVLTNEHVVDELIKVEPRWNNVLKREVKTEILGTVEVDFFQFRWEQRAVGATSIEADIVAYDKEEDLALLKLRGDDPAKAVVKMYPKGQENKLRIGMPTIALGAALLEPPVLTAGRLSQFGREIDNREFWMQTAPTIFGNSGGAVFLEDTEQFIGVPARVAVIMSGFMSTDAITHLSYIIPITRVYEFIDNQMFRFIYDDKFTEEGENAAREAKRKEEELKLAAKETKGVVAESE